ncbi:MAG: hypothetical protein KDA57_06250 [Planctomycetales bacterium]|nr:hypothetical protein [Planctomycetales bacterium]
MRLFARTLGIMAISACSLVAQANESSGPVYQRQRSGYGALPGMGHYPRHERDRGGYYQQQSSGNWFVRPYPYHFDYYRWRYSAPTFVPNCPCEESPALAPQPAQ